MPFRKPSVTGDFAVRRRYLSLSSEVPRVSPFREANCILVCLSVGAVVKNLRRINIQILLYRLPVSFKSLSHEGEFRR